MACSDADAIIFCTPYRFITRTDNHEYPMNLYLKSRSLTLSGIFCCCLSAPLLISGVPVGINPARTEKNILYVPADLVVSKSKTTAVVSEAGLIYENLKLKRAGLNRKVFEYAWKGYKHLLAKGEVSNKQVLSICDFSLSSRRKRLFVIDLNQKSYW